MGPSKIRKALGAVKDQTSISLAKVGNSTTASELEVAIVKATRHDEYPAEEKHLREILSLTCYSRTYVSSCVALISRRLGKTRSWTVALKTLILVHRLLTEGDPSYEQEIFFATRRGTRMLNMSDFRDTSRSDAWDFSAFVRTYALYLDQRLEYRMHGRRHRKSSRASVYEEQEEEAAAAAAAAAAVSKATPVREMKTDRIFARTQHLQQLMERFLACRPTGAAKNNRVVSVALYPLLKESFQLYYDLAEIMGIFIDRFMEMEVPDCVRVYDVFSRLSKQYEELDVFYSWCKTAGVSRPSDFPEIERITAKKLEVMDEFIRDRSALAQSKKLRAIEAPKPAEDSAPGTPSRDEVSSEVDMSSIRALPAPETSPAEESEVIEQQEQMIKKEAEEEEEVDFLNLKADATTGADHADRLALALFDGNVGTDAAAAPKWEAFKEDAADWETALVESAGALALQKVAPGGGFDMLLLDGMYSQAIQTAHLRSVVGAAGSASSVALPSPARAMLALPAPPTGGEAGGVLGGDPFAASLAVPPPAYVQMSDMEGKQRLLVDEKTMWEHYTRNGMQGQMTMAKLQQQQQLQQQHQYPHQYPNMGGYINQGHMF